MKKKLVSIVALILVFIMLLGIIIPVLLQADQLENDLNDMQNQQQQIENQIGDKKDEIAALNKKLEAAAAQVEALADKIAAAEQEVADMEAQIAASEELLVQTEAELAAAETDSAMYSEALMYRIKIMYETKDASYLEILLQSQSISDFFCKMEFISQLMEYDKKIMDGLEEAGDIIAEKKVLIEDTLAQQRVDKEALNAKKAELEGQYADKNVLMAKIMKEQEAAAVALEDLETMNDELNKKIKDAEKEIERRRKEEEERRKKEQEELKKQQQDAANKQALANSTAAGFVFRWPLKGYTYLTSQFGPRTHPITGVYKNHNGCDIPAPSGTKISAVESGVVITAKNSGWNGGYGKYVMISHGNGYVSLYAHCSKVLVSEGDYVSAGDVIALVGTTGSSTGNHLHLELRINGKRVDPELYIPKG